MHDPRSPFAFRPVFAAAFARHYEARTLAVRSSGCKAVANVRKPPVQYGTQDSGQLRHEDGAGAERRCDEPACSALPYVVRHIHRPCPPPPRRATSARRRRFAARMPRASEPSIRPETRRMRHARTSQRLTCAMPPGPCLVPLDSTPRFARHHLVMLTSCIDAIWHLRLAVM